MSRPDVAVVIPTRDRETRLAFALEALAAQTLECDRFEVIVVRAADRASGELTMAPPGLEVRFLVCDVASAAAQRNVGWAAATAPLVAFTDDDCRPAPDWLEQLLVATGAAPGAAVQGRTVPDPDEVHLLHGLARTMVVREPDPWYPTCNIAYPRELLERVGGFDESFAGAWGEDTDLALRSLAAGGSITYADRPLVFHAVHARSVASALRDSARRDAQPLVLARHPSQRRLLHWGVFLRRRHARVLLALLGAVAFGRGHRLAGLLAISPWVAGTIDRGHMHPLGLAHQCVGLPSRAIVDLADTATTIRAAIRNRVLVI